MDEDSPDISRLISQRKQRPAFARMISWEFSQSAENPPAEKSRKQKRKERASGGKGSSGSLSEQAELERKTSNQSGSDLSELVNDSLNLNQSGSSDESEYFSAVEDELDIISLSGSDSTEETVSTISDDVFSSSVCSSIDTADSVVTEDSTQSTVSHTSAQPQRQRRLSKRQKKKRARHFRIMYANEFLSVGNILDVDFGLTVGCEDVGENTVVKKQVPSLVSLCLQASSRDPPKQSKQIANIPPVMKNMLYGWKRNQALLSKQLSWLQNHILSYVNQEKMFDSIWKFYDNKKMTPDGNKGDTVNYVRTRNIWNSIPCYRRKSDHESEVYVGDKSSSYLLCCYTMESEQFNRLQNSNNYNYSDSVVHSLPVVGLISALASTIDIMMPATVTDRFRHLSGGRHALSEQEVLKRATQNMAERIKSALRSRFPRVVDNVFDLALPYVMWSRGNVQQATELFIQLSQNDKRSRYKALYLSEVGRMNTLMGDGETGARFYRLAAEMALEKNKYTGRAVDEVTEQNLAIVANILDQGVLSAGKARQASTAWNSVLNLPKALEPTAVTGVESLLCYHGAHWSGSSWLEEVKQKIENQLKEHSVLYGHLAFVLAAMGRESDSNSAYRHYTYSGKLNSVEGLLYVMGARVRNPWQPLIDLVTSQKQKFQPIKVVWRTQLCPLKLSSADCFTAEADMRSIPLNLRFNEENYVTADVQMLLPPIRELSLDPFTGYHTATRIPSYTEPWENMHFDFNRSPQPEYFFIPTMLQLYQNGAGDTVHLLMPGFSCMDPTANKFGTPSMVLHWTGARGEKAKVNLLRLIKDEAIKKTKQKIEAEVKVRRLTAEQATMSVHICQLCYKKNLRLDYNTINSVRHTKEAAEKRLKRVSEKSRQKTKTRDYLGSTYAFRVDIVRKPITAGALVMFEVGVQCGQNYFVFLNCHSRDTFSKPVIIQVPSGLGDPAECVQRDELLAFMESGVNLVLLNMYGEEAAKVSNVVNQSEDHCYPAVVAPYLFYVSLDRLSVNGQVIGDEDAEVKESWEFLKYFDKGNGNKINQMMFAGGVLITLTTIGISFLEPVMPATLITVTTENQGSAGLVLNEDNNIVKIQADTFKILQDKEIDIEGRKVNRILLGVNNKVLIFEVAGSDAGSASADGDPVEPKRSVSLKLCISLPGFPTEACMVGPSGEMLVCFTQQKKEHSYYREHVYHLDNKGRLVGMLPYLGVGPRSFFPVCLHGNSDSMTASDPDGSGDDQEGWHVYMRDGHDGIICIKLDDCSNR